MTVHPMPDLEAQESLRLRRNLERDVFPDALLLRMAGLAVAIAAIITFAVHLDVTGPVDRLLFDFVHMGTRWTPTTSPAWWNEAVRDLTALGGMIFLTGAVVATCASLVAAGRYRLCGLLLASAVAATVFSTLTKLLLGRVRPDSVEQLVATTSASFPSGHALLSAAIILTIGGLVAFAARRPNERRVIVATALCVTFCVGMSRIWLGVHWPSDVLAGWLFGAAWAALTLWLAKRMDHQG